jgi:hypothetical protein
MLRLPRRMLVNSPIHPPFQFSGTKLMFRDGACQGEPCQDKTRQDKTRQDTKRQNKTRKDRTRRGERRQNENQRSCGFVGKAGGREGGRGQWRRNPHHSGTASFGLSQLYSMPNFSAFATAFGFVVKGAVSKYTAHGRLSASKTVGALKDLAFRPLGREGE